MKQRIAIVGSGVSGLSCAHFLHRDYDLSLFEQDARVGGHANTVVAYEKGQERPIDTGFMVFNHETYPLLTRLFRELGVATKKTDMSFSVQNMRDSLEYNGGSLDLLFVQRRNLLRPAHWKMLLAINRFNREAVAALDEPRWQAMSLGEYVRERGYGQAMYDQYLVPMSSAVWSTPPEKMNDFPATTLLRFWHNHGFLGLHTQKQWMTVEGGSREYVAKITAPFADRIFRERRVTQVTRAGKQATLHFADGPSASFDKVILAAHGDAVLSLLSDPSPDETRLLAPFAYQENTATLHTDASFMPQRSRCWAAWNYRLDFAPDGRVLPTTHYWMNRLQGVSPDTNYFVSLNCADRIAPDKIVQTIEYRHPLFDRAAIHAQTQLAGLNAISPQQTTYYAGAWFKYGFHEDGFASGLDCARAVTGQCLWGS
jgi:uncharacterized protein